MKTIYQSVIGIITCILVPGVMHLTAQNTAALLTPDNTAGNYQQVNTYINPVLPGDHPDPTMIRVGADFFKPITDPNAGFRRPNHISVRLYPGFNNGKEIIFSLDTAVRSIPNKIGNTVWLKVERNQHQLSGYYSADGKKWLAVGAPISAVNLDKVQPNYNSWVGTSVGLFAEGKPADFDFFICKDGYSLLPAVGSSNYYGIKSIEKDDTKAVTNSSGNGGWLMISGVELGKSSPASVEVTAAATATGNIEIWLDDLKTGRLVATIPIGITAGNNWKAFVSKIKNGAGGHHDVFIKFPTGKGGSLLVKSIRFIR